MSQLRTDARRPFRFTLAAAAVAAVAGLGLATSPAQAEFQQGDFELRLSGFAQNNSDFDAFAANVGGQLGYFLSDQFEAGIRQDLGYSDLGGGSNLNGATSLFVNYHFGDASSQLQPFIGLSLGYIYGDGVNDTFVAGPEIGLKYFFDENWFFFRQVEYQFFFDDAGGADDALDDGVFNYRLGLGVILEGQN